MERVADVACLALEKAMAAAPDRLHDNLRFLIGNAENLGEWLAPGVLSRIYLNFSDPWPKNRHEKRRLTHKNFLKKYESILNGDLEMKTDNQTFFEYSLISFNQEQWNFLDLSLDLHHRSVDETIISTEYEERFIKKGNQIYFLKTKK